MVQFITRHFLLMMATSHNGKEKDFQLFMLLLESDRFFDKFRDGVHKVNVTDLMRRTDKKDISVSGLVESVAVTCLNI